MKRHESPRPYESLHDGRFDRLNSDRQKLVYLVMAATSQREGLCAGWLESNGAIARLGVDYYEWRRIKKALVDVGLITPACEILP